MWCRARRRSSLHWNLPAPSERLNCRMSAKQPLIRLGLTAALGIGGVIAAPSFALASCVLPPPFPEAIRKAPAVFVGTVVDLRDKDRTAVVELREVWKGAEIGAEVEVRGSVVQGSGFTSVDRTFELSREYLFLPYEQDDSVFRDNACTRTTPFRTELTRFRPASAGERSPTPAADSPPPEVAEDNDGTRWLLLGAALLGVGLIAVALLRRQ